MEALKRVHVSLCIVYFSPCGSQELLKIVFTDPRLLEYSVVMCVTMWGTKARCPICSGPHYVAGMLFRDGTTAGSQLWASSEP